MKRIFTKVFYVFFIIIGLSLSTNTYSQTVVQWYTSMGDFRAQLREDLVPMTAQNFIDLSNNEFYDDFIFHRVISGFMIQDGCPNGNGTGGPGYSFDDEFHPDLRHDEPGILSMANAGPNTNGSQYFITVAPTAWLDDVHAVFGKIIDGMEVVYAISEVETYSNDKPIIDVVIDSIRVVVGDPSIELLAPTGGIHWNAANDNEITWESAFIADVKIEFSSDNGQTWTNIIESTSANTRSFDWEAPNVVSDECLVKISDVANPDVFSITESPFTLSNLDLLSPDGFETFRVGTPVEVTWESEFVSDLSLAYQMEENGEWFLIEDGIAADDNSYMWTPEVATNWCKIKISELAFPEVFDVSFYRFFVIQLDLTAPAGGENIVGNSEFNITWEREIVNSVKIEFSSDNGENWSTVVGSMSAGDLEYMWTVPNIYSNECFIKLSVAGSSELFSINQTPFTIYDPLGIDDQLVKEGVALTLSPNPVVDNLNVSIFAVEGKSKICKIEIYSANGELVLSKTERLNSLGNQDVIFDLQELPQGFYMMKLVIEDKTISQKFIKR